MPDCFIIRRWHDRFPFYSSEEGGSYEFTSRDVYAKRFPTKEAAEPLRALLKTHFGAVEIIPYTPPTPCVTSF